MAMSKSIEKAQTFAKCQFCEESPDIKWKCIICDLFLCQLCNSRIHSKSDALREHKVINLKECGTEDAFETIRRLSLQKLPCSNHEEQMCCVYCSSCEQSICALCLGESHQNHKFTPLKDVYKERLGEVKDMNSNIDSDITFLNTEEDMLQKLLSDGDRMYQVTKNEILQQEKKIKEAVTKHAQELIQELDTQWKPTENEIQMELCEVTKNKDDLLDRKKTINQTLLSDHASDILNSYHSIDKTLPRKSVTQIKLKETKFIPAQRVEQSKSGTFGELYKVPEINLVKTYQTDLKNVTNILHSKDNTAFISSSTKILELVRFEDKIKVQNELKVHVFDMTMMTNGNVLISSVSNDLKLYDEGGIKIFKSFSPLCTLGVHVSDDNDILVGITDSDTLSIPIKDSVRKVVVLNQNGDLQHSYEFDRNHKRLFIYPVRIHTFDDNICVIDRLQRSGVGQVVLFNQGGQLQWVYKGHDSVNKDISFHPTGLSISNTQFLVVSDYTNHALHVLNKQGEIILCKIVKDLGITFPLSLQTDTKGMLWLGCNTKSEEEKAKIHCICLS